jgi:hypothetical protein
MTKITNSKQDEISDGQMTCFGHWNFDIGICLIFGACILEFCHANPKKPNKDIKLWFCNQVRCD